MKYRKTNWYKDALFYHVTTFSFTSYVLGPIYGFEYICQLSFGRLGYIFDKMVDDRKE